MARYTGKSVLKNVYNVRDYHPLDTRMLVPTYADLTLESNWLVNGESNAYNGMIVAVGSNKADYTKNGIYFLFDKNNPGKDDVPEVTKEENWHKLASLSELSEVISQLQLLEAEITDLTDRVDALEALEAEEKVHTYGYRKAFPAPSEAQLNHMYIANDQRRTYIFVGGSYLPIADQFEYTDHDNNSDTPEVRILYGGNSGI
jgi:hypothetical protein